MGEEVGLAEEATVGWRLGYSYCKEMEFTSFLSSGFTTLAIHLMEVW